MPEHDIPDVHVMSILGSKVLSDVVQNWYGLAISPRSSLLSAGCDAYIQFLM